MTGQKAATFDLPEGKGDDEELFTKDGRDIRTLDYSEIEEELLQTKKRVQSVYSEAKAKREEVSKPVVPAQTAMFQQSGQTQP